MLPLVLHTGIRGNIVAHNNNFGLHRFIHTHPDALVNLPELVNGFRAITKQAVLFGCLYGALEFSEDAEIVAAGKFAETRIAAVTSGSDSTIMRAASRLGTWFSQLSDSEIVLHLCLTV